MLRRCKCGELILTPKGVKANHKRKCCYSCHDKIRSMNGKLSKGRRYVTINTLIKNIKNGIPA